LSAKTSILGVEPSIPGLKASILTVKSSRKAMKVVS